MDPYIQRRLQHYKTIGVRRVRARASGRSDECEHCRALDGVAYNIDEVPEFPPRGCTCAVGCGCSVTHVPPDGVLKVTIRDDDVKRSERPGVTTTSSPVTHTSPPDLQFMASESWLRFISGVRSMFAGAGQLLWILTLWIARLLARATAHCIHFVSTTFPEFAMRTWARTRRMFRQRGKSLSTWASATLTAPPSPALRNEAVKVKVEG